MEKHTLLCRIRLNEQGYENDATDDQSCIYIIPPFHHPIIITESAPIGVG